ncbi:hypothetical protein ACQ4M3_37355 [Leptolyngbya sp. AN03gr2]|uniref:hypothetical protein n=1 Tax=unclassified Leptolyngbya TaxID=2650499 RepID=UPI003D3152AF
MSSSKSKTPLENLFAWRYPIAAVLLISSFYVQIQDWKVALTQGISPVLTVWMIDSILQEVWKNRRRFNLISSVYFRSGIRVYIQAITLLILTLTIAVVAYAIVPGWMKLGWTSFVFNSSTNLAVQPFQAIKQSSTNWVQNLLLLVLWAFMVFALPFLAEQEEQIFRSRTLEWTNIARNSLVFGLIHLVMGVPLIASFVLAVPGFAFGCRYRQTYYRSIRKYAYSSEAAHEEALLASTKLHSIYNAIAITILVGTMAAFS